MANDTNFIEYRDDNSDFFIQRSTPFLPKISLSGEIVNVKFNAGYVFDYANGGEKIEVGGLEHIFSINDSPEFIIRLKIQDDSGAISSAEIVRSNSSDSVSGFTNIKHLSPLEGSNTAGEEKKIELDLAEFDGPHLIELYIRENIHLWFRGMEQKGGASASVVKNEFGILNPDGSSDKNSLARFRSVAESVDKMWSGEMKTNILSIQKVDDTLVFFVPDPCPCSSESGSG
jgi:hypothetical protein